MRISDWSSDVCSSDLQCVGTRMRCQRDFPCQVRLTKARMRSFLKREIGQPVVDHVDPAVRICKPVRTKLQFLGCAYHAVHAMLPECAGVQIELGVEELLPRGAVHDGQTRRHPAGLRPDVLQPGMEGKVATVC